MTLAFLPDKKIAEAFKVVGKTLAGAAEDVKDFFKGWGRRRKRVSICLVSQSVCLSVLPHVFPRCAPLTIAT